jgi:hypothetical protein
MWRKNHYICDILTAKGGLLMSTKNEVKEENMKVDRQLVEPSATKQLPSIWYS